MSTDDPTVPAAPESVETVAELSFLETAETAFRDLFERAKAMSEVQFACR